MRNNMLNSSRDAMMAPVRQSGFAAFDAHLYLDTHPCDTAAIPYFRQMTDAAASARTTFEAQNGPLTASQSNDASYFNWVTGPWPWEGGMN